jgi:hypothetical protein
MHEIEEWIESTTSNQGLSVRKLSNEDAKNIVLAARAKYVYGNPRAWWLSLRIEAETVNSGGVCISKLLPSSVQAVFVIPETESADPPVYELSPVSLDALLNDCPFFEYYVVDQTLGWLVIESDHNQFLVCRSSG